MFEVDWCIIELLTVTDLYLPIKRPMEDILSHHHQPCLIYPN